MMLSHRYALPFLSGFLLALVFFPFYLWPLALVALAPLFYFARQEGRGLRQIFWGGVITGVVGIGPLIYLSLAQLTLFPDAVAFTYLIRASSIPTLLLVGILFGALALSYRFFAPHTGSFGPLLGGALYLVLIEAPMFWVFDGYYYGALSHAVVPLPGALAVASVGGATLASFFAASFGAAVAETVRLDLRRVRSYALIAAFAVAWVILPFVSSNVSQGTAVMHVAVVQGALGEYLHTSADLLIFPSSNETPNSAPASVSPILVWDTMQEGSAYYDEYALWQGGVKSVYRKRELYALSDDYTPRFLQRLGIEKSPTAITAGGKQDPLKLKGVTLGALICSELHQQPLARATAAESSVLIAVGSDVMFPGPLSGNFSLAAARLRAAESGVPLVRANLVGPSAIINADGSVQAQLAYGESGLLRGEVQVDERRDTLYAKTGSWPVYAFALLCVAAAIALRRWGPSLLLRSAS